MGNQVARTPDHATRFVVMGVSGCGKSEIGRRLADRLGCAYAEGDEYHPPANIAKMAAGTPLDDTDRQGWLELLQAKIREAADHNEGLVLSCSALKRRYRDLLRSGDPLLTFIHLDGNRRLIASRMHARPGHFMPLSLLDGQLLDLEPLEADERGVRIDISQEPDTLIEEILQQLAVSSSFEKFGLVTPARPTVT